MFDSVFGSVVTKSELNKSNIGQNVDQQKCTFIPDDDHTFGIIQGHISYIVLTIPTTIISYQRQCNLSFCMCLHCAVCGSNIVNFHSQSSFNALTFTVLLASW